MIDLTQSLLQAISIIADRSVEEISSDKTIKAIIKKNINTSEGKYLITYNDGDFYAYTQSGSTDIYQAGEEVYILVPEDDMSQKKFIIGRVEDNKDYSLSEVLNSSLLNDYIMIGDNAIIEKEYPAAELDEDEDFPENRLDVVRMQPLKLDSHSIQKFHYCYLHDPSIVNSTDYDTIQNRVVDIDEEVFSNSAKQAKALLIRSKFKANLDTDNIGNYGIIVNIAFADETNPQVDDSGNVTYLPKLVAYILDTSKMTGNPMRFYDYVSQYTIVPFDGEKYLYIDSIIAFSEGFVNEETDPHDEYDDVYIYMDNLEIIALDEISAVSGDYKLRLITPKGNTIKVGRKDELKINAIMSYSNQDITQNTVFYWGVKDFSVTSLHDDYNSKLGTGYRWLKTENSSEITLTPSDLTAPENIYACVAVYESNIILKTFVSLYNNNNKVDIEISSDQGTSFQFNEGRPTLTCLINKKTEGYQENYPDDAFSFIWSKEDPDYGIILLDKNEELLIAEREAEIAQCDINENGLSDAGHSKTEILSYYSTQINQAQGILYPSGIYGPKITCKLKNTNTYVTYSCSVYRAGVYIGYGSITLQNHKDIVNNNYYIDIINGNQVFQYDEAGISPNSQKQQNPIDVLDLTAVFRSPQGAEVTPKRVRWIMPQGQSLINIPSLGLETDIETGDRYFEGSIFPLSIKDIYDSNCNDNQVIAVVTHADGTEYRQSSNLLFTKVGEIGTNGTDIVLKINEKITPPIDECLTIIKSDGNYFYNEYDNSTNTYTNINREVLEADLYTNNFKTLGYTTQWTIADKSGVGCNYVVESNLNNNTCKISYNNPSLSNLLDTRIIKAQTSLNGKYLYNFYGMPAIEYNSGYTYNEYPIKIIRQDTLKNILYDSNGTNPSYNENQGIHVEFPNWNVTGYLEWAVESGIKTDGEYENPNLLLSRSPKSKTGSKELNASSDISDIEAFILEIQDMNQTCLENSSGNIKNYINQFLIDVEEIALDNLLPTLIKIDNLEKRINVFKNKTPDKKNIYIQTIYEGYTDLLEQIKTECQSCKNLNEKYTKIYDKIQKIWNSEWPSVITSTRLNINSVNPYNIKNIQELIQVYQKAYDDRSNNSNNAVQVPIRSVLFKDNFNTLIGNELNKNDEDTATGFDKCYIRYCNSHGIVDTFDPVLVEYAKILITYLFILIDETQKSFGEDDDVIKNKYSFIYDDWNILSPEGFEAIGKNIYDIILNADSAAAGVYDNIRSLYQYYQSLYINIKKYQIAEDSETFNVWISILNGEAPNLLKQIYIVPNDTFNGLYMNNNVVGTVFIEEDSSKVQIAKIYIPIIMTLNTYELPALNGWDGTSVDIGEDHIMTPQIGAGIKDSTTNTFTGMVMGVVGNESTDTNNLKGKIDKTKKVGLIGYSDGKQSLFIDSKTGKACFGLPESDDGTNEGRIELVPGGISKIGNWKIGSHFLYNIVDGSYEQRVDTISRNNDKKLMIPHDKHGIILSSEKPYIHIKGEVYENNNLKDIDYADEYNNINVGDSLELRLDPGNDSLFSIVQHTIGFGDEDNSSLLFGYKSNGSDSNPSNNTTIKDYIVNKNFGSQGTPQIGEGVEYHIYKLDTDNVGKYKAYYQKDSGSAITKNSFSESFTILNTIKYLSSSITETNFKRTIDPNPVFKIDTINGIITYNPDNLAWNSDNEQWQSVTRYTPFVSDSFNIGLNYSQENNKGDFNIKIGNITNSTGYKIRKISFGYSLKCELENIEFIDSENTYIQFYVCVNDSDNINSNNVKLISNKINIWDNYKNISSSSVELFSNNEGYLANGSSYKLKARIYTENYAINANCSYQVNRTATTVKELSITPEYGSVNVVASTIEKTFKKNNIGSDWGSYKVDTSGRLWVKLIESNSSNPTEYDIIVWKKSLNSPVYGGRIREDGAWVNFKGEDGSNYDKGYVTLDPKPSSSVNDWYVSFYAPGTFMIQNTEYTSDITTQITYDFISPLFKNSVTYGIKFGDYSSINFSYGLKITNLSIQNIYGFSPISINEDVLCVESTVNNYNLQGIRYALTYWKNDQQRIRFYSSYYIYVNNNTDVKAQYGFIDINNNNGTYYKYIKTLKKQNVNTWFNTLSNVNISGFIHSENYKKINNIDIYDWVDVPVKSCNNILNWKEFIRVGLDENGRFYTAGLQDKKTYSRTGRIFSFGKVADLYGQEIRTLTSNNNYTPIIKIFSKIKNNLEETTYITKGKNDNGSISIRTAGNGNNHFVELGASQNFENETGSIPEVQNFVRVSYNKGVQIQTINTSTNPEGINSINLTNTGLSIETPTIKISSNNIQHQFSKNYTWTRTPYLIISSDTSYSSPDGAYSGNTKSGQFRISASKVVDSSHPARIDLQIGEEAKIRILSNQIQLKTNDSRYILINNNNSDGTGLGKFAIEDMMLQFNNKTLTLKNKNSFISIQPNSSGSSDYSISISSNLGGKINLTNKVTVLGSGGFTVSAGPTVLQKELEVKSNAYMLQDLHIGYKPGNNKSSKQKIYLYKNENKNYVRFSADDLEKIFSWFNNNRWAIGYCEEDNTLYLKNVINESSLEGAYDTKSKKYNFSSSIQISKDYTGTSY